jgi:DNA mismatch repair protein MutS2
MDDHSLQCLDFERICELLAAHTLSGLGRGLARNVRPMTRVALIRRWLAQVTEMQRLIEERGTPPFGGITDIRPILERCGPPLRVTVEDMAAVASALEGTHALAVYLRDLPEDRSELRHLAERVGDFQTIADRIRQVIDQRGQVRDEASPKLRQIRGEIDAARGQIQETVARLLRDSSVRRLLQYPNHTFAGDRLVLPLRSECRGRLDGIIHRTSDSGATLYVEPATVVELNNRISNLRSEEIEEINRLLWDLSQEVHLNAREIRKTMDTLGVIDLIVAKVRFARQYEMHCPDISDESVLAVRQARHPLLLDLHRQKQAAGEQPPPVVPIDFRLGQDFSLLIITGPNTGGKTVTLKTVGLLCLMVQAGLPVPTERGATFGVFSNILIDVGDEQSMQQSLSTFSAHLTRILDMLRHAGERALLLVDEVGAGTDPDEGAALGRAILDELLRSKSRAIVTTHLGTLKGYALSHAGAENACVDFDNETLRPTYHLLIGQPGQSNAIEIARRLGMPKRMINTARQNTSRRVRSMHAAIESTRNVKREAEQARRDAELAQQAAAEAHTAAQQARSAYEQKQADFQQWVQRVVHLRPGDPVRVREFDRDGKIVRMRLDQHRAEVDVGAFSVEVPLGDVLPPEVPAPPAGPSRPVVNAAPEARPAQRSHGTHANRGKRSRPREQAPRPARGSLTPEQIAALKPQDSVFVKRFHRLGRVVRINHEKQLVLVNMGMLEVEVPLDGLALPTGSDTPGGGQTDAGREARRRAANKRSPEPPNSAPQQT